MFRIVLIGILLLSGNVYAQNACNEVTWDEAKRLYDRGKLYQKYLDESNDVLCLSNPGCVRYQSKDKELQKLAKIKDKALKYFHQADSIFQWILANCDFKMRLLAKSSISSVETSIGKIHKDFSQIESECLWRANKVASSHVCN